MEKGPYTFVHKSAWEEDGAVGEERGEGRDLHPKFTHADIGVLSPMQ
jgi:hypothetical protein